MAPKRKLSSNANLRTSKRVAKVIVDSAEISEVVNGVEASRASPDEIPIALQQRKNTRQVEYLDHFPDPDSDPDATEEDNVEDVQKFAGRPPAVNSDVLPLPWKGRLGYACLNTYLRTSNPPVFSSRTCRIASILEHRHPLQHAAQPEHPTKNRPDKTKPADLALGQRWVENLGLANARDAIKMLRWNDRYGIRFLRLSSEMFPFASHEEYGYTLAPFASETLADVGKVVAELGHRVSTHPGQFTQLGSPRESVVENAVRDLEYHDELLTLLKLPDQQDRDAVMILHMGGVFEGKEETLNRFRANYARLSPSIKRRLVLENDDVSWSVHDLLPICRELNIPLVLDFHHHNIVFDRSKVREGTRDIVPCFPAIRETWTRKAITQKMHYSEPTPAAVTGMQRRKHSARVATLPPCAPDMDLMIEAKDKEQAVFELMRNFRLPGFERINDVVPHVRADENKQVKAKRGETGREMAVVPGEELGMGGPEGRVYWPPGMEEWLRPKKREVKPKVEGDKAKVKTPNKPTLSTNSTIQKTNPKAPQVANTTLDSETSMTKRPRVTRKRPTSPTSYTSDREDVKTKPEVIKSRRSKRANKVSYTEAEISG